MEERQAAQPKGLMKYRYSRRERESMPNAPSLSSRKSRGVFRGNRPLLFVLLDVLFLLAMFLFVRFFLFKPSNVARLGGYRIEAAGRMIEDGVFAVVRIENRGGRRSDERADVRISLPTFNDSMQHFRR